MTSSPKFDLEKLLAEFDEAGKRFAEAYGQAELLSEHKKIVRAKQMEVAETKGCTALGQQERFALASPEYLAVVQAWATAEEETQRLRMRLKFLEMSIEAWRTAESSARMERRAYPEINVL